VESIPLAEGSLEAVFGPVTDTEEGRLRSIFGQVDEELLALAIHLGHDS
jgi:hypothetical protein